MRLCSGWTRLALLVCGSAVLLAAAPTAASACPSFAHLKAFNGTVGEAFFEATASAEDPGNGGIETITISRDATALKTRLAPETPDNPFGGAFGGKVKGHYFIVGDHFVNSGSGAAGALRAVGPIPGSDSAQLLLYGGACEYQFSEDVGVKIEFSGTEAIDPGERAGEFALSPKLPIPNSLDLSGNAKIPAYPSGCEKNGVPSKKGCYDFDGGWETDFGTLQQCGSVTAEECSGEDEPAGTARFRWSLIPVFRKSHHAKHT
jgi:hypothetical protein